MNLARARTAPPASTLSAEQYAELRSELKAELQRLLPRQAEADERTLRDLAPQARRRATKIVDVLRRMNTETYGVCVSCQSPIAYERLSVIPETTVCAHCSRSRELLLQS